MRLPSPGFFSPALAFYFACFVTSQCALTLASQVAAQPESAVAPQAPALSEHPSPALDAVQGFIHLDVLVTDRSGRPVSGLESKDFSLLDNGQPQRILSFAAFDGISAKPDRPVEVILVIDTIKISFDLAAFEREEVERFLRQNGGHLALPTSIFGLSDLGLWTVDRPSSDGNALATELSKNRLAFIRRRRPVGNGTGEFVGSLDIQDPAGLSALKALGDIATGERKKPGRKLLIWVGPGWGNGSGREFESLRPKESEQEKQTTFDTIYWFSTLLREARIALYGFSVGENDPNPNRLLYLNFLNGVESVQQASLKNLDRRVLAVQSGGRVLSPGNDLVSQIDSCVQEANVFYTLSFDPSHADHPGEYHSLKVQIGQPDLAARTNNGYYDQPYYSDQSSFAAKRITVEQLEKILGEARGKPDAEVARQLSDLELTEMLSSTELSSEMANLRGKKARESLVALADASAFLEPPRAEVSVGAPPDLAAQRSMTSLALEYLNKTTSNLPNFYATRTTVRYEDTPQYSSGSIKIDHRPLHVVASSKVTVLYRNGKEIEDSEAARRIKRKTEKGHLTTYGTFGPLLGAVRDAIASGLTWVRWEQNAGGPRAVFHYAIAAEQSRYQVGGCCLPDGDGTSSFEKPAGYHGEIAIDPANGAILRLELVADIQSTTPLGRSDIMIEYGPVPIGGKTYICPVRSVSLSRARSVAVLTEWDESFRTYGPFATLLNDVAFDGYHLFRAESHMVIGNPPPAKK